MGIGLLRIVQFSFFLNIRGFGAVIELFLKSVELAFCPNRRTMNSFRLVLCLTGLLAYVIGRHFTSSEDKPVILTGPGQNLTGVGLSVEKIDPGSLISKRGPSSPAILKAVPEPNVTPVAEKDDPNVSAVTIRASVPDHPRHLTLNAAAALK